jgi:indolepyruvate ferredoxin oxidoreductase, beta subunit
MSTRPLSVLVAALGGEGGGLLADWLVAAALAADLPVQSTSIPGVAQRTGATTYYLEIFPQTNAALGGKRPLFALYPTPGAVDLVAATELLEAGRMIEAGFVTPERTTLVAGIHRVYATIEKMQMGDGRFDAARVLKAAEEMARRPILFDLARERRTATQPINAVLLGAIAGSGDLPIARGIFEQAIRDSGIAVESNLAAFALGWELAETPPVVPLPLPGLSVNERAIVEEGVKRLGDYQDAAYAQLYLTRLERVRAAAGASGGDLLRETARHLALWMAYEDVIRVAQLKSRAERLAGIRAEIGAKLDEPVHVREFFKPGLAELAAILPPRLGAGLSAWAERRGVADRWHLPLKLRSTTVTGHLLLRLLAAAKPWRRRSHRFAEEQQWIERWLEAVSRAAAFNPALALEIALCGRLIKGYGDTHKRGLGNFTAIMTALVEPALARRDRSAAAAVKRARDAALADPEGKALSRALAAE